MKHQLSKIRVLDTEKALRAAEALLVRPERAKGGPVYVQVPPRDIRTRLELFQPRRPGWGTRTLDTKYVNRLVTRISRKGVIDPVLVVKLEHAHPRTGEIDGHEWVVVDGHHRLEAYRKLEREEIECEWFAGTVREAWDESVRRNERIHLEVQQGDKAEAAWARTLLDWNGKTWSNSKQEVVTLTGCSEGIVARMRRAVKCHANYNINEQSTADRLWGEKLHTKLGADLRAHTWSKVNEVLLDLTPKEQNDADNAAKLARQLNNRMTNLLSNDPETTAHALWLYDRDLCPALVGALQRRIKREAMNARSDAAQGELEESEKLELEKRLTHSPF
jgi:hypothetical protein